MKKYVIVDLEATCYDVSRKDEVAPDCFVNEIIEIGAVKLDENGVEIDRFEVFAKPLLFPTISKFCNELTTITQEDVDNAQSLDVVLEDFINWCDGTTLISWGYYDKTQILKDMVRNDLDIPHYLDIVEDHHSLKHLHAKWNNLKHKRGIGMSGALKFEGLEQTGTHHRGIDDAVNIAKIFRKYIDRF